MSTYNQVPYLEKTVMEIYGHKMELETGFVNALSKTARINFSS